LYAVSRAIFFAFFSLVSARAQTVQSIPLPSLPANSKIMIWGDSITEVPAYYPGYIEGYVLACAGRQDVKFFTTGHSGATLSETISREIDLQAFNPTMVTFFYGTNDISFGSTSTEWDENVQAAFSLYKSKGITAIIVGPEYVDDTFSTDPTTTQQERQTLATFSNIGHTEAVNFGEYESDIYDLMDQVYTVAEAVLGPTYQFGVHFLPNGGLMAAYEDILTLGCNGNIGAITVDMSAGTATASTGHTVVNYSNGTVVLDSTKYPFCYNFDPNEYSGASGFASILPYLPFSQNLNQFTLTVKNLGAASANVTWGSQTVSFTSAQLAAGVNLPANFTTTPFDTTFAQFMTAVLDKEYFENYEVKLTGNYNGNDNGGNVDENMIAVQAQLDAGVKALLVPVRHTITIVPAGASTHVAPVITGTMVAYPTTGQSFSYQISALNSPTSYTEINLPAGLALNQTTGVISGSPTSPGKSVVTLTATNTYGPSLATTLTLYTNNALPGIPAFTSASTATATVGAPFSYQATATNSPANFFYTVPGNEGTEPPNSSLPPGLTYNTTSGVISGTPTVAGTYPLQVAAMNSNLNDVIPLMTVTLTVNPAGGGVPPAPTGLTATAGSGQVTLNWTATAGATSYDVYRGTSAGGESATALATNVGAVTYNDTNVTSGMSYYYTVTAVNTSGQSSASNEAHATPLSGLPSVPANLMAAGGNDQVTLNWTASTGATSYHVYRGTLPGQENTTTPIATQVTSASYVDTTVTNGPTYYYKVAAVNTVGTSSLSNEANATPGASTGSTIYYQDGFSRTGDMTGSAPDVMDAGGATWSNLAGTGEYPVNGTTASINPAAYSWSAEYLPVNGTSGVTLDGTKNFTLSVVVTPSAVAGDRTGISLNTAAPGNLYSSALAAMSTCTGFEGAYLFNNGLINYNYGPGVSGATTISLVYSAAATTLTYNVGSSVLYTQTGVTAAQIASIRYVALGDDGYGGGAALPAPTFDVFTLSVGNSGGTSSPATLTSAVSRLAHGGAGMFDLNLPLTGTPAVEDRAGATGEAYSLVLTFSQAVTSLSATLGIQSGHSGQAVGSVGTPVVNGTSVTIPLAGIANAQRLDVHLTNIEPGGGTADVPINFLLGDVNGDGAVNSVDLVTVRNAVGEQAGVSGFNPLADVNRDGAVNSQDLVLVRDYVGSQLP
jgi:hypothetical protein